MRAQKLENSYFQGVKILPKVRCPHRRDVSQNLRQIETEMHLEAVVEIATNFPY